MQYQDESLAKQYGAVRGLPQGFGGRDFAATQAVVWNLAKVTLIKDEPYVAYLLTRYEKKSATSASTAWTCPTATGLCTGTTRAPSSTSAATASACASRRGTGTCGW